jgi:hypothetical protein
VAQATRIADPVQRDTAEASFGRTDIPLIGPVVDKALGSIQARVPGLSDNLPAKRDVFGAEVRNEGGIGPDIASPIWTKDAKNDPIIAELMQMSAKVGRPSRRVAGRKLTPREYEQYQAVSGQYIREDLTSLMSDADWRGMDPEQRIKAVDKIRRDAREAAREELALDAPPLPAGFEVAR